MQTVSKVSCKSNQQYGQFKYKGGFNIGKFIDMTGQTVGRLKVIRRADDYVGSNYRAAQWECVCSCPQQTRVIVRGTQLRSGHTNSCGCYHSDITSLANTSHGDTVGGEAKRLYRIWAHMLDRCENPNANEYKDYGGRGVKVCDEWHDYAVFKGWAINNGYEDTLSIDRIEVDGDYEPGNCRWAGFERQANNTRRNRKLTLNGETHTMAEWSRILGIPYNRINTRIHRGWPVERALSIDGGDSQ